MSDPISKKPSLLEPFMVLFVGILIVANIIAQKFWDVTWLGINMSVDVGTLLLFPMLYIFSDIFSEVYGYATSRRVVWYGFAVQILAAILFSLAIAMPHSKLFTNQDAFKTILGSVPFLVVASMVGYLGGSFTNDIIMVKMKEWTTKRFGLTNKWIPLRTISSTFFGELVDTALFVAIATILGVFPEALYLSLVLTQWLLKVFIEAIMTPVTLIVIRAVKKYEGLDVVGTETLNPLAVGKEGGQNFFGLSAEKAKAAIIE
jgi:hypothetical protein